MIMLSGSVGTVHDMWHDMRPEQEVSGTKEGESEISRKVKGEDEYRYSGRYVNRTLSCLRTRPMYCPSALL